MQVIAFQKAVGLCRMKLFQIFHRISKLKVTLISSKQVHTTKVPMKVFVTKKELFPRAGNCNIVILRSILLKNVDKVGQSKKFSHNTFLYLCKLYSNEKMYELRLTIFQRLSSSRYQYAPLYFLYKLVGHIYFRVPILQVQ